MSADEVELVQTAVTELVGSPDWPAGRCIAGFGRGYVTLVGEGQASQADVVGIPGLRLTRELKAAGFEPSPVPIIAHGGWIVFCKLDREPTAEDAAVVRAIAKQCGFPTA